MIEPIKQFLSLSLSGTAIFLIVWILRRFTKKYFSKKWVYYSWLLVAFRLILPVSFGYNIMNQVFRYIIGGRHVRPNGPVIIGDNVIIGNNVIVGNSNNLVEYVIFVVWVVVSGTLIIRKITKYQSFSKYISAGWKLVDEPEKLDILGQVCEDLNVNRLVELHTNPLISSPVLMGILKPTIVLPHVQMNDEALYYILLHEMTHYKRKDLLYKWFIQLVICLHWFNPILYLFGREMNKDCEFSCDEAIIIRRTTSERMDYGETLLTTFTSAGKYKETSIIVPFYEDLTEIKQRLVAILTPCQPSRGLRALEIILSLLLISLVVILGVYRQEPFPGFNL
ncbi:M56 family metallopeptidase [Carnobacterium gallinarum]|uniref:M56 family metallopeptidase n=1 Tax=Carnobacterium gallinarum TaxID=2749 RepID=UPI0005512DDD|nr:M56 family metallopeptidase [Carnobacterium gallinarum]